MNFDMNVIADCTGLTSIILPYGVTSIGWQAFYGYSKLTSITIPNSVTSIGNYAFYDCTGLTSITIPDSVTSIGVSAFGDCTGLTSITIPNSVTSIGENAFNGCTGLTSITIPDSVTSIGEYAFGRCEGLTSITIPNSVTSIARATFRNCSGLTSITIPNGVTAIGNSAFSNCSGLTSITIPDSVTSIGNSAFTNCHGLTSITIPNSVTSIASTTFRNCSGLTSITIPNGITSIGEHAFGWCDGLTSIIIPESVTSIDKNAFRDCTNLWHVLYKGSEQSWNAIDINADNNNYLLGATLHYNCTGNEAVDSANKICNVCQSNCTHAWDGGKTTKEATCKEEGVKTFTCSICKDTKTESVPKLTTHTYDNSCDTDCNVCGNTRTVTHQYSTAWSKDQTSHWHVCSICTKVADKAVHTPGAAATETTAQTCTTCGYVIKAALGHTHKYDTAWSKDASGHWHACACGAQDSYAAHSYKNSCDTDCDTCGHTRTITHTPGPDATATTDQTCTVCGKVLNKATGVPSTEPPTEPSTEPPTEPDTEPSTEPPTEPDTEPGQPTDDLENILDQLLNAEAGSQVVISQSTVTNEILEAAKGKDVSIVLSMDNYHWTINGTDISGDTLTTIDLSVALNTQNIPTDMIDSIAGDAHTMQLSLAHNGEFGFDAALTVYVGTANAGQTGNLYYYTETELILIGSAVVDADGGITLPFSHASDYVLVLVETVPHNTSVWWPIVSIAAVVALAGGGAAAGIILWKKKH